MRKFPSPCALVALLIGCPCSPNVADESVELPGAIRIAFTSLRDDRHSAVYLYERTADGRGKILGRIPAAGKRSDHHPALGSDGSTCYFAAEVVGSPSRIAGWSFSTEQPIELASINDGPNAHMAPALARESRLLAYSAWNRPGASGRWDILLYDLQSGAIVDNPLLNSPTSDERKPSVSSDGSRIALTTNARSDQFLTDVVVYSRSDSSTTRPPNLNSTSMDTEPSLSGNGRWLAFTSDRPGGVGARDIFLYDLQQEQLQELPGLNSVGQEQSPALSHDGRFLAFVSERLDGEGERDIYIYDRIRGDLISLPGLNSPKDEYDPCIVLLN